MGLKILCHECSHVLYEGFDLIPFFKLRSELNGKCPNCKNKLAIRPVSVEMKGTNFAKINNAKM